MTRTEKLIFGLMVIPAALCLILMDSDYEVEVQEAAAYCEMVEIWMNDPRPEIDHLAVSRRLLDLNLVI